MAQMHIRTLNKTLTALGMDGDPKYCALIELARTLARQMDAAMPEPGTRLSAAYLSAVRNLMRIAPGDAKPGGHGDLAALTDEMRQRIDRRVDELVKEFG